MPQVIVVYDVGVERINKVRNLLKKYLFWVQNSVFEGELTPTRLKDLIYDLKQIVDEDYDDVRVYKVKHGSYEVINLGKVKGSLGVV